MKRILLLFLILISICEISCTDKKVSSDRKDLGDTDIEKIAKYAVQKYGAAFIYYDVCNFEVTFTSKPSDYTPTPSDIEKAVEISKDILNNYVTVDEIDWEKYEMTKDLFNTFYSEILFVIKDGYGLGKENS